MTDLVTARRPDRREPFCDDPHAERRRRLADLALAYRLFGALRWGDMGDGHISCRDPEQLDHFWMLAHGVSFRHASVQDLVRVGPDGSAVDSEDRPVSINVSAYHIHHPIHVARPDVVSAAHTHTQWGTPFAAERRPVEPISQESTIFFEDHALFDDEEVQVLSTNGGRRIADSLGDNSAVVLANHGLLTVGRSVADCVGRFVLLERVTEVHMKARDAVPISAESARTAKADLTAGDMGWEVFQYLTAHHCD